MANGNKQPQTQLQEPVIFKERGIFIPVDQWVPEPNDNIIKTVRGAIMLDVSGFYGTAQNPALDSFIMNTKRSYNNPKMRDHTVHYLNYFEKFYDPDHELVMLYYRLKYLIDYEPAYSKEAFFYDLSKYIMHGSISIKIAYMNRDNYSMNLTYQNKRSPNLIYNNKHGQLLMKMSLMMNAMIPLLCHFMYVKSITNSTDFLLEIYDALINISDVDMYNKLFETAISNVLRSVKGNPGIWNLQDIRGINSTIHAIQCVQNILINIICKYRYDESLSPIVVIQWCLNPLNCWDGLKSPFATVKILMWMYAKETKVRKKEWDDLCQKLRIIDKGLSAAKRATCTKHEHKHAGMVELVDTRDLRSRGLIRVGSTPTTGTRWSNVNKIYKCRPVKVQRLSKLQF